MGEQVQIVRVSKGVGRQGYLKSFRGAGRASGTEQDADRTRGTPRALQDRYSL